MSSNQRIVVIGDTIIDVLTERLEDATRPKYAVDRHWFGGVWNSARMIEQLGWAVQLVTALPIELDEIARQQLVDDRSECLIVGRPDSLVKRTWLRFGDDLIQINSGDHVACPIRELDNASAIDLAAVGCLVQDYGHRVAELVSRNDALPGSQLIWDTHPKGAMPPGRALVTARASYYAPQYSKPPLLHVARRLMTKVQMNQHPAAIATYGAAGALGYSDSEGAFFALAHADSRMKYVGSGDLFGGALCAALATGVGVMEGVRRACADTAVALHDPSLCAGVTEHAETLDRVALAVTSGYFDPLSPEHITVLRACRRLAGRTVVLLNSDDSVRRNSPVRLGAISDDRTRQLQETGLVDEVKLFDEDTLDEALRQLNPSIYVKGSGCVSSRTPECGTLENWGGLVLTVPVERWRN